MYVPGLKNLVADALGRLPDMAGSPDSDSFGRESNSGPWVLHDLLVYSTVEDRLKVVAQSLVLADYV